MQTFQYLNDSVNKNEGKQNLMQKFDDCSNSFLTFNSKYKLLNYLKTKGCYVEPIDIKLGTWYEQKLNKQGIVKCSKQIHVNISQSLK